MVKNSSPMLVVPDQRTAALSITIGWGSPGICSCTVSCMPVKGLMILSTRHPMAEMFRTDPAWRKWFSCTKVLEKDTGNLGCFLVTIAVLERLLCDDACAVV
jgi:hypothetical protein